MLSSTLYAMLMLSMSKKSPQKLFDYDCMTLYYWVHLDPYTLFIDLQL